MTLVSCSYSLNPSYTLYQLVSKEKNSPLHTCSKSDRINSSVISRRQCIREMEYTIVIEKRVNLTSRSKYVHFQQCNWTLQTELFH
ncbi:hypothetical protein GJ496_010638 [Pomphorhynchus laevis]|nr:hypothetical protein GJ496_010638 [Pomphorhynchus laevis]